MFSSIKLESTDKFLTLKILREAYLSSTKEFEALLFDLAVQESIPEKTIAHIRQVVKNECREEKLKTLIYQYRERQTHIEKLNVLADVYKLGISRLSFLKLCDEYESNQEKPMKLIK